MWLAGSSAPSELRILLDGTYWLWMNLPDHSSHFAAQGQPTDTVYFNFFFLSCSFLKKSEDGKWRDVGNKGTYIAANSLLCAFEVAWVTLS